MNNKQNLLIEIGTEEIPLKQAAYLSNYIKTEIKEQLFDKNIDNFEANNFYTLNRIIITIKNLPQKTNPITIIKKGPPKIHCFKDNKPTKTLKKFLESLNISLKNLKEEKTSKGTWLIYIKKIKSKNIIYIIKNIIKKVINNIKIENTMKWSNNNLNFIRPISWILIILNNKIIRFEYNKIKSNNFTYGNKYLKNKKIKITNYDYENLLKKNYVLIDCYKRKNIILNKIKKIEEKYNVQSIINNELLNEIKDLTEYPYILIGKFKEKYLNLPKEIIILIIQKYNKCIPLKKNKKIINSFIIISHVPLKGKAIDWYNFSLNSKFSKILHIFNQEKINFKKNKIKKLKNIIFQEKLGSIYIKTKRIKNISLYISKLLKIIIKNLIISTLIAKLDLSTILVTELPELEGVIGSYYIKKNKDISLSLKEQYKPKTINDKIPKFIIGKILSISDNMDTIVGLFLINKFPVGNKDPYSIKRKTISIIKIIIETHIHINIAKLIAFSLKCFNIRNKKITKSIFKYFIEKLKIFCKQEKHNHDIFNLIKNKKNLYKTYKKSNDINIFLKSNDGKNLINTSVRIKNIIKDNIKNKSKINLNIFDNNVEKILLKKYIAIKIINNELFLKNDYYKYLINCSKLIIILNSYFEKTIILDKNINIKENRMRFLNTINNLICRIIPLYKLK